MAKFTLEIRCDNAAFVGDPQAEIARILRDAANAVETQAHGTLRDVNGNRVGTFTLTGATA